MAMTPQAIQRYERQQLTAAIAAHGGAWTLASLSRALGRNAAYLQQYMNRHSPRRLPETDRHQLAELLLVPHHELCAPDIASAHLSADRSADLSMISVPFFDIKAAAGPASIPQDYQEANAASWQFDAAVLRQIGHSGMDHLRLLRVRGDSMAPQLLDGDVILMDQGQTDIRPSGIFVLDDGHGLVVKQLEWLDRGDASGTAPRIRIISTNPAYAPYRRAVSDIRIIGRVIWMSRPL